MNKFDKVIAFLKSHPSVDVSFGIYNSRNAVGDPMETVYHEDGITIDACYHYGYIEIFGLSDAEFRQLAARIIAEVPHYEPCDDVDIPEPEDFYAESVDEETFNDASY